jgi:hypothetical protein
LWPLHACAQCLCKQYVLQSLVKFIDKSETLNVLAKADNC